MYDTQASDLISRLQAILPFCTSKEIDRLNAIQAERDKREELQKRREDDVKAAAPAKRVRTAKIRKEGTSKPPETEGHHFMEEQDASFDFDHAEIQSGKEGDNLGEAGDQEQVSLVI